jgi:FAD/FMN-containing dehydrogenase
MAVFCASSCRVTPNPGPTRKAIDDHGRETRDLLAPGDGGYDTARSVWNGMIDRRPLAISRCKSVEDVIASVRFAGQQGLPVSIRGGGHNVAGHAVCDGGLMIDLSCMRGVAVNPGLRSASVQGGALWADVDAATQAHGLATPGGLISETGVAGLTLSGGVGWLRSAHGLSTWSRPRAR